MNRTDEIESTREIYAQGINGRVSNPSEGAVWREAYNGSHSSEHLKNMADKRKKKAQ